MASLPSSITQKGTTAAVPVPTTPSDGITYWTTDGAVMYRSNGTIQQPWGPIYPFTEIVDASWAWVNQGNATKDTTHSGVYLEEPSGHDSQIHLRTIAVPAAPYTMTAAFTPNLPYINFATCGIGLRESGSGKLVNFDFVYNSGITIGVSKWTNPSTFSANYSLTTASSVWWGTAMTAAMPPPLVWQQISDDNTNRHFRISIDGYHWHELFSVSRTDFLTPDQVTFFVGDDASFTQPVGVWMRSIAFS